MTSTRYPVVCGVLSGLAVSLGFLAVSAYLFVQPGHPIATRTDVFFQSDAGGLIQDAVHNFAERARGTHPLLYPLWTRPLHHLVQYRSPTFTPEETAVGVSRVLVAGAAGLGLGLLAGALATRGLSPIRVAAFVVLAVIANGHALAAIPDHFGFSVGGIAACFASALTPWSLRRKLVAYAVLAFVLAGITITNVLLPIGLATLEFWYAGRWSWPRVALGGLAGLALAGGVGGWVQSRPDISARIHDRVGLYLNVRLVNRPVSAMAYSIRGVGDAVVAPTPQVNRNNLDRLPMLTYEPGEGQQRPLWPYDPLQTVGVLAWFALLANGCCARPGEAQHVAVRGAAGWVLGNAAFHNCWGDEYFLYAPHIVVPLLVIAALGFRKLPTIGLIAIAAVVTTAALSTLHQYHSLLESVVE